MWGTAFVIVLCRKLVLRCGMPVSMRRPRRLLQLFLTTLWPQFLGPLSNLGHALEISYRALECLRIASAPKLLDPKPLLKHAVPQFIPVTRSGGIFLVVHRSCSSSWAATANQLLWLRWRSRCFAFSIVPTAATIFAEEGQHVWSFVVLT